MLTFIFKKLTLLILFYFFPFANIRGKKIVFSFYLPVCKQVQK